VTRSLRVGLQLPEVERVVRRDELAAMARTAEERGFDSIWVGDHLLYRGDGRRERGPWDCWTTLAWLAGITERVELGPLVACTAFHPPGLLARQAAAIDELSGGRFIAALGAGWNEEEFRAFGIPFDRHVSRFEEAFTIVRRLLAGERVTFEGRFHTVHDAVVLPTPSRRPKLMVGATAPRMLAIALPHVDAWNTWYVPYGNTPEGFAQLNAEITAAAERAGRDPAEIERSACVLVEAGPAGERPRDVEAVPAGRLPAHLRALGDAGADEAILVLDPITDASIRSLVSDTLGV
jgi:alkanesulfonate monooxygenase SsuD/methylene tetrahydromethanopterin reductase-like flavin-dependent oxidoreductase (luciferase family)